MVHRAGGIPPQLTACKKSGNQALSPPYLRPGNMNKIRGVAWVRAH